MIGSHVGFKSCKRVVPLDNSQSGLPGIAGLILNRPKRGGSRFGWIGSGWAPFATVHLKWTGMPISPSVEIIEGILQKTMSNLRLAMKRHPSFLQRIHL